MYEMRANTRKEHGGRLGKKTTTYLLIKHENWRCRIFKKLHECICSHYHCLVETENFSARVRVPRRK